MGALYGFREEDLIDGVKAFSPLDVLDSALTAWRAGRLPAQHLDRVTAVLQGAVRDGLSLRTGTLASMDTGRK